MTKHIVFAALLCALHSHNVNAADYVAVQLEAEYFTQKNALWRVFSNSSQPNVSPDPDGSHHSTASGNSYLELLPDTRVTHSDSFLSGTNFWSVGGQGPSITYSVNFPEAGRYTVWVKAYSTGSEDNGIHVGINNTNPGSGERMQWCSGKNSWTWSSAQRTSSNHCGVNRGITLDVPFAGANSIVFSAREDGFEFDQFMLIKENVAGLLCAPNNQDQISCNRSATGSTSSSTAGNSSQPAPEMPSEPQTNTTASPAAPSPAAPSPAAPSPAAPSQFATCLLTTSDSDGDGYGWENEATCVVASTATGSQTVNTTVNGFAVCNSANADSDGDGWGWENNRSCVVTGSSAMVSAPQATNEPVYCASASSDVDGDGWGWENNKSCIVR